MWEPTASIGSTSSSLLQRLRTNDAEAWDRMSRLYVPLVYGWACASGLQDEDAADVVQEVFRSVAASIHTFDQGSGNRFRAWLWGVTRNKLREHFRRVASRPRAAGGTEAQMRLEQLADEQPPDEVSQDGSNLQSDLVHRALENIRDEFEDRTWKAFWRASVEGQTSVEIAESLGMTKQAVRQAKYRVLRRLRQELDIAAEP